MKKLSNELKIELSNWLHGQWAFAEKYGKKAHKKQNTMFIEKCYPEIKTYKEEIKDTINERIMRLFSFFTLCCFDITVMVFMWYLTESILIIIGVFILNFIIFSNVLDKFMIRGDKYIDKRDKKIEKLTRRFYTEILMEIGFREVRQIKEMKK